MQKRKINKEYLHTILSSNVKDSKLDVITFADTLKRFADEYLKGLINLRISGYSGGYTELKIPVVSYFIRLLCEEADDEPVECEILLGDNLTIKTTYPKIRDHEKTAFLIRVAKFAGFNVDRDVDLLIFTSDIRITSVMQIYAISSDELMYWLVTTHKM